ncbi:MAG: hypothetical protein IPK19_10185 [Chloroflexi bacterium]|nr:hypothetical protein [Chloroflexota bacterium]
MTAVGSVTGPNLTGTASKRPSAVASRSPTLRCLAGQEDQHAVAGFGERHHAMVKEVDGEFLVGLREVETLPAAGRAEVSKVTTR